MKSSECSRYDEPVAKFKGWDTSCPFVATEVADEFGITGTDRGHKLKLLVIEVNPAIPNLPIQAKPKSVKRTFEGNNVSMPAPPSKKVLVELDSSMVEHGELETGIPCVPITIEKRVKGKIRTTEAHSRKFTLVDICQRLLNQHEKFMRLHCEKDIAAKYSYCCHGWCCLQPSAFSV